MTICRRDWSSGDEIKMRAWGEQQCPANHCEKSDNARLCPLLRELYDSFIAVATPEQLERFEHWKRSKIPRAAMRRLMTEILGSSTERGAIVLSGLAKMFVGELVESAREQMTAAGETGPIQPRQLRAAHRQTQRTRTAPGSSARRSQPRLFWRSDCGP